MPPHENEDTSWIKQKTSLSPPQDIQRITRHNIVRKVRMNSYYKQEMAKAEPIRLTTPDVDVMIATDEQILERNPARVKADLSIRRLRFADVRAWYIAEGKTELFKTMCKKLRNMDYIAMCNILNARLVHEDYFDTILTQLDAYQDVNVFSIVASTINQIVKKYPCEMSFRLTMAEAAGLTGYRQPPFPGFDERKETQALCDGGAEHGLYGTDWLKEFERQARKVVRKTQVPYVRYVTLDEYIRSDQAKTSGASSIGKVEYEFEGETEKFKARKNFLLDIYAPGEVLKIVNEGSGKQTANAFVKPELGKCRIAVTGDVSSYYIMSWLNDLAGHSYLQWPSNTLEENALQQTQRMETMMAQLEQSFSLPFDYKGFDRQPTTEEIQILMRLYLEFALENVPLEDKRQVEIYIEQVIASFSNATTTVWVKGQKYEYTVKGGVQSGIRFTSLLGNFWNMVMSSYVYDMVRGSDYVKSVYVRGDDSAIIATNYASCLLFRLGYMAINAVGHDAKYGIHYENSEFLRVWYTPQRLYGYPNRAIPGLMQRKPWTGEPWDEESTIRNLIDTVNIIKRRTGREYPKLLDVITTVWARKRKASKKFLELPRSLGGLGLLPWRGWLSDKPYPKVDKVTARFVTASGSEQRYKERYAKYAELSLEEAIELQQNDMNAKASDDDVRGYNRIMRQKFSSLMSKLGKVEWKLGYMPMVDGLSALMPPVLGNLKSAADMKVYTNTHPRSFGKYRYAEEDWKNLTVLAQIKKIKPVEMFKLLHPTCYFEMRQMEKHGWHRGMALDYLFGKIQDINIMELHPMETSVVEHYVATEMSKISLQKYIRYELNYIVARASQAAVSQLRMSALNKRLFMW